MLQQYNLHPETQYFPSAQPSWPIAPWPVGQVHVVHNGAIENGALDISRKKKNIVNYLFHATCLPFDSEDNEIWIIQKGGLTIAQHKARRTAKLSSSFFTYVSFFWKDIQYSDAVTDYISPISTWVAGSGQLGNVTGLQTRAGWGHG